MQIQCGESPPENQTWDQPDEILIDHQTDGRGDSFSRGGQKGQEGNTDHPILCLLRQFNSSRFHRLNQEVHDIIDF